MLAIFNVVFPIFALIFAGYICRKRNILSINAASELNRFVIYLGLPALIFNTVSNLTLAYFANVQFISIFGIGVVAVFGLTAWVRHRQGMDAGNIIIDSLGASYPNVGFVGLPLCLLAFGHDSVPPAVISMIMTACLLFAIAIVLLETFLHKQKHLRHTLRSVASSLIRNPIMVAPILGGIVAASGYTLPGSVSQFFTLLGGAATPCALISLGLFLALPLQPVKNGGVGLLVLFKLILQPAITALFAYWIWPLPKLWADSALLLSALPIGTGPFMLAELYRREAAAMSRAILFSTLGSLVTISAILAWTHS